MQLLSEVESLKGALDELVEAHEGFDRAAFDGDFDDIARANARLGRALSRAKLAKMRFESASRQIEALRSVLHDAEELADLERRTRLGG